MGARKRIVGVGVVFGCKSGSGTEGCCRFNEYRGLEIEIIPQYSGTW